MTVHPSFGRVFAQHPSCQGFGMCNNIFAVGPLDEVLLLAAELKKTAKQDLDMERNVPKFNFRNPALQKHDAHSTWPFSPTHCFQICLTLKLVFPLAVRVAGVSNGDHRMHG